MCEIVKLPNVYGPTILHFGSTAKYERFAVNSYFIHDTSYNPTIESMKEDPTPITKKHHIIEVIYDTDEVYRMTDGYAGDCWKVKVVDYDTNEETTYYIRNWNDIVQHYVRRGFIFVESKDV